MICSPGKCHHFVVVVVVGTSLSKPGTSFPIADSMGSSLGIVVPTFCVTADKNISRYRWTASNVAQAVKALASHA